MKKFFFLILIAIYVPSLAHAKQLLPDIIENNTITITAQKTGELGKNYFYCSNGNKCSTEQVVREYYKNNGYNIMRAEYSFWKGIFVLTFLDELYPHTINTKTDNKFFDIPVVNVSDFDIQTKYKYIRKANLQEFVNGQIKKHENSSYIRWLDEWEIEGYKNPIEYFKLPIVQNFLTKIDNKTFCTVISHILELEDKNPIGTPDYIVWNNKEMIFVEVKRKNEKLSPEQIEWGEYLTKNKIPYKIIRVIEK
ncbi:VRR-NUC domain-containing protein [bacterium]|nr:VRR-NUC domain-containing protein [bacterium]